MKPRYGTVIALTLLSLIYTVAVTYTAIDVAKQMPDGTGASMFFPTVGCIVVLIITVVGVADAITGR